MPDLDVEIYQKYRDQDVLVIGIHPGDSPDAIQDFLDQTGISFPLVRDQGTKGLFAYPDGVGYPYPRDVIIGKDLTVRSIKNSFSVDETDELIRALLAE